MRRKQRLRVRWANRLSGDYPVTAYEVPRTLPPATNDPGHDESGAKEVAGVAELPPWSVTHLHGAVTDAWNDGWAQNAVSPSDTQQSEYPNDQRATALWYHDHAMHITRWNVYSGLVGMYLIRDEEEDALRLPKGDQEIPSSSRTATSTRTPTGGSPGGCCTRRRSSGRTTWAATSRCRSRARTRWSTGSSGRIWT
ncbi:multicopper oxidase domain-containing protein [Streptomyces sp. M19]